MKKSTIFVTALAIFLTIADTVAKQIMLRYSEFSKLIIENTVSITLHKNGGAVANIPVPMVAIQILTLLILVILARWLWIAWKEKQTWIINALIILILGALGNLTDRMVHGFTTDYILLFGRSVINISDIMIFTGVLGLLVSPKK